MPTETIPLVLRFNQRFASAGIVSKDQRVISGIFETVDDESTNSRLIYVEKRGGVIQTADIGSAEGNAAFRSVANSSEIVAFGTDNSTIYYNTVSEGVMTGLCNFHITEAIFNSVIYWFMVSSDGTGWYLASDAVSSFTFTGSTHTNTTIDSISSTAGLHVGQLISGTGIQALTRIASIDSATAITTTLATTATNAGITITREGIAKIIDADFPAIIDRFVELDGFMFAITSTGRIYNSDLNNPDSWGAAAYMPTNVSTDNASGLIKWKKYIIAFGDASMEFFQNVGNPSPTSPLARITEQAFNIGAGFSQLDLMTETNDSLLTEASDTLIAQQRSAMIDVVDDSAFFVSGDQEYRRVYALKDGQPTRISTESIEKQMSPAVSIACAFKAMGQTFLYVTDLAASWSFFYSLEENAWIETGFDKAYFCSLDNPTICVTPNDTNGYTFDIMGNSQIEYEDDDVPYTLTVQTRPYSFNNGLPFIIDNVTLLADNQTSGSTQLYTSADDYTNFGYVGDFDLTTIQKNLSGGGYYDSSCIFKLTDSGNNAWRGRALQVTWRPA